VLRMAVHYLKPPQGEVKLGTRKPREPVKPGTKARTIDLQLVKTYLTEDQYRVVRHAAAERNLSLKDYLCECIMADAFKTVENFVQRAIESKSKQS